MSVPLDQLYNFYRDNVDGDAIIYRWSPHGSRKMMDLLSTFNIYSFYTYDQLSMLPAIIAHDQEPLDYFFFNDSDLRQYYVDAIRAREDPNFRVLQDVPGFYQYQHLRLCLHYSKVSPVILHSELRSENVAIYEANGFVPCYTWSHALIARDWFRFAEVDVNIDRTRTYTNDFLIYNRAWTGSREYRLKFCQMLLDNNLDQQSLIRFSPEDSGLHYLLFKAKNSKFQLTRYDLHEKLPPNPYGSDSSATYLAQDYACCGVEIVLETLFDDQRWHLTEKTLRPIACSQPFVLASTPGSLEYLRGYGFETFDGLIDESYDRCTDHFKRLQLIIQEMRRISDLSVETKRDLFSRMHKIARRNRRYFFSREFHDRIVSEFRINMSVALTKAKSIQDHDHLKAFIEFHQINKLFPELPGQQFLNRQAISYQ